MSLPTPTKTWQITRGRILRSGTATTDFKAFLLAIKNALKGFGSSPWVVRGSWNGAGTGALDGTDRWAATSDIVWAGYTSTPLSSLVLKQPGMPTPGLSGGMELLFDCGYGASSWSTLGLNVSVAMITAFGSNFGGSSTSPPSATVSQPILVSSTTTSGAPFLWGDSSLSFTVDWVVMQTTDGACTRIFATIPADFNNNLVAIAPIRSRTRTIVAVFIETLTNTETGTTIPYAAFWQNGIGFTSGSTTVTNIANVSLSGLCDYPLQTGSGQCGYCAPAGTSRGARWSILGNGPVNTGAGRSSVLGGNVNIFDGNLDAWTVDVVTATGTLGYVGTIQDLYVIPEHAAPFLPASSAPVWDCATPGILVPCGGVPFARY